MTREADFEGENCMTSFLHLSGVAAAAIAFAAFAPSALAEEATAVWTCQAVGASQPEPLGDREGHSLDVGTYSCRVDGGLLSGGVATGSDMWEWDGPKAVRNLLKRRDPQTRSSCGVQRRNGKYLADHDRRQGDRLDGLGNWQIRPRDRRLGAAGGQDKLLDCKTNRPGDVLGRAEVRLSHRTTAARRERRLRRAASLLYPGKPASLAGEAQ